MRTRNCVAAALIFLTLSFSLMTQGSSAQGQTQPDLETNQDTARAIEIHRQGNATEAIKLLQGIVERRPNDADAWCYLGFAFYREGQTGISRPAFEQCVRLRPRDAEAHAKLAFALILADQPKNALAVARRALELGNKTPEAHYAIAEASFRAGDATKAIEESELALSINPNFTAALITRSLAHYHLKQHSEAAASLEQLLAVNPNDIDADVWRGQLEELRRLKHFQPDSVAPIFSGKDVTQKARVLSKPEPQYSEAARLAGVTGTVVLRGVFSAEGDVKHIVIVRALGYGLTTHSVKAARQIRFAPAMKDGTPVPMFIQLEYNFNLY
jgi:TonB family protein